MGLKMQMLMALVLAFAILNVMAEAEEQNLKERAAQGQAKSLLDLLGQNCK